MQVDDRPFNEVVAVVSSPLAAYGYKYIYTRLYVIAARSRDYSRVRNLRASDNSRASGPREQVSIRHTLVSLRSTVEIVTLADVLYDDRARSKAQ